MHSRSVGAGHDVLAEATQEGTTCMTRTGRSIMTSLSRREEREAAVNSHRVAKRGAIEKVGASHHPGCHKQMMQAPGIWGWIMGPARRDEPGSLVAELGPEAFRESLTQSLEGRSWGKLIESVCHINGQAGLQESSGGFQVSCRNLKPKSGQGCNIQGRSPSKEVQTRFRVQFEKL